MGLGFGFFGCHAACVILHGSGWLGRSSVLSSGVFELIGAAIKPC